MSLLAKLPVIGGMFDDSNEKARNELLKNQDLWSNLQLPNQTWENYSPEDYQSAGQYDPEMMQAQTVSEDPMVRSAQMSALQKMAGLADTGMSDVDALGYSRAAREAGQGAQGRTQAALSDARNRGVAGGGLEFALREIGNQNAADQQQESGLTQAADAAKQRALYNQAYLSGNSDLRNQDFRANQANTDILNEFNKANTQNKNAAQQYNLANRQGVMDKNTAGHNEAQQYNQTGRLGVGQQNFQNQLTKMQGQTGQNDNMAKNYYAEGDANAKKRGAIGQGIGTGLGFAFGGPTGAKIGGAIGGGIS